jgi:hypothetical protein
MGSPVPSLDIRGARGAGSSHAGTPLGGGRQKPAADGEIPRLEIDARGGGGGGGGGAAPGGGRRRPSLGARQGSGSGSGNGAGSRREGVGGWISDMIARTRGGQQADSESGSYRPVGQRGDGDDGDDDGHYEVGDGGEEEGGGEQRAGGARAGYAPVDAAGTARRDAGGGAT